MRSLFAKGGSRSHFRVGASTLKPHPSRKERGNQTGPSHSHPLGRIPFIGVGRVCRGWDGGGPRVDRRVGRGEIQGWAAGAT